MAVGFPRKKETIALGGDLAAYTNRVPTPWRARVDRQRILEPTVTRRRQHDQDRRPS
jgi:hypothetical protein